MCLSISFLHLYPYCSRHSIVEYMNSKHSYPIKSTMHANSNRKLFIYLKTNGFNCIVIACLILLYIIKWLAMSENYKQKNCGQKKSAPRRRTHTTISFFYSCLPNGDCFCRSCCRWFCCFFILCFVAVVLFRPFHLIVVLLFS